jgi:pimeloyl-ACP methyl ester carboxylesterase
MWPRRRTSIMWLSDAIARQAAWLPGLTGSHVLEGCGHWVPQERPDEVNDLLLDWLRRADRRRRTLSPTAR